MERKKLVFLSSIASPHQIRFCEELQKYFDASFLFYDEVGNRPNWWKIKMPKSCQILKHVWLKGKSKYFTFFHLNLLNKIKPDILMLGGFSIPANYIAYLWAKANNVKTIVFTERSRNKYGILRKKDLMWSALHFLYRNVDLVIVSADDSAQQFKDFGFERVVYCPYATDLASYFNHPIRTKKSGYVYLFPNRLTTIYNPVQAIEIFYEIYKQYPESILKMNAQGELYEECLKRIDELSIKDKVIFLNQIESWEDMNLIYRDSDIMIFPALFSNGNYTIIEAMASGMGIVISNKVLGLGTIVRSGQNGFNVEPQTDYFVKSIKKYIQNPGLFTDHALTNRKIAYSYSAAGVSEQFYETVKNNLYGF